MTTHQLWEERLRRNGHLLRHTKSAALHLKVFAARYEILISGAGIAGPTLAYWLARYGFEPTIVERATPRLRTGGYIIDFWGAGFDIAERMELLPEISRRGYTIQELRVVDSSGRKVAGFPAGAISHIMGGRFLSLLAATWLQRSSARLNVLSKQFLAIACSGLTKTRSDFV